MDKEDLIIVSPGDTVALYNGIKEALWKYKEVSGVSYESIREKFDSKESIGRMYEVHKNLDFNYISV